MILDGYSHFVLSARTQTQDSDVFFQILSWLRNRGVQKIIKVIVREDNHGSPPSTDEIIEKCQQVSGVEVMNWVKPDLRIQTTVEVAPDVEELVLYFSGFLGICSERKDLLNFQM
jgi:hypothetical protein